MSDGAHAYIKSVGVDKYGEGLSHPVAVEALRRKHGGSDSLKIANNTYLQRRMNPSGEDTFAVRLHETDIIEFHPDLSVTIRTGGYYSMTTRRRIESYTDLTVWAGRRLQTREDTDPRWFVLRRNADVRSGWSPDTRPHHYVRFDRPLRLWPNGAVRKLSDTPTRVRYKLVRGRDVGNSGGVYSRPSDRVVAKRRGYGFFGA